jgi:PASTA domain
MERLPFGSPVPVAQDVATACARLNAVPATSRELMSGVGFNLENVKAVLSDLETALKPGPFGRVVVPDLVGLMVQDASLLACRVGLTVNTVVLTLSPAPVEGKVVRQHPPPGKKVRRGDTVTLHLEFPARANSEH